MTYYAIISVILFSIVFAFVRIIHYKIKWPMWSISSAFVVLVTVYLLALIYNMKITHPLVFLILFIVALFLLVVGNIVIMGYRKSAIWEKIICGLACVIFIGIAIVAGFIYHAFGDNTVFRQQLKAGIYFEKRVMDNGIPYNQIAFENPIFVYKTSRVNYYDWDSIENVRMICIKDSLMLIGIKVGGKENIDSVDLRFEFVGPLEKGIRVVSVGNKQGAIDFNGKVILPLQNCTDGWDIHYFNKKIDSLRAISKER